MAQPRKYQNRAEQQAAYRQRKTENENRDWEAMQRVVREAATLCRKRGLPYETLAYVEESLRQLQQDTGAASSTP